MKCSMIIRCYNEEEHIGRLLTGIMEQTIKNVEIILVDSGSTDATLAISSRFPVKIVSIKPEDFSFGRSLNIGCQHATGEFIAIASAHVYPVYKDWLEKMLQPFVDNQIGLVYGKQRGNEITKYTEHQIFAKWFSEISDLNQTHPFCNNANAAIRRDLWSQISYDESLTGLEDLDWSKKILSLDYKIAYVSDAEIVHVHNETFKKIYNRYYREALAFKQIFPDEIFRFRDFVKFTITNTITDYYHAWYDQAFWENLFSIPTFRFMQFWGTYKGFLQHGVITSEVKQTFYYPRKMEKKQDTNKYHEDRKIDYYRLSEEECLEKIL